MKEIYFNVPLYIENINPGKNAATLNIPEQNQRSCHAFTPKANPTALIINPNLIIINTKTETLKLSNKYQAKKKIELLQNAPTLIADI